MLKNYPVIDMHAHLREDISEHTKIAKESGIDIVVYMANCSPPLDNLKTIKKSLKEIRHCRAIPVSAMTVGLNGKKLVDVERIKPYVAGFSDDGKYMSNFRLLKEILEKEVLVLAHCCPDYETAIELPYMETICIEKYLDVLSKTKGKLHIQHVSREQSVQLIRDAKKSGLEVSCETCPHYFTYAREDLDMKVNPPLRLKKDLRAIERGLEDGTIDVIASDYAPLPRKTGIAGFRSLIPLSYGLVQRGILSEGQLKEKLCINPLKIIESGGYRLNI